MRSPLLLALFLLASCSGSSGHRGTTSPSPALPANPDGILLDADPTTLAIAALRDMVPSAAPPATILDGFFTTRLEALVDTAATVGAVNAALTSADAAIVSMHTGFPVVTLVVPPMADPGEAAGLADELVASGAFGAVTACFVHGIGATTRVGVPSPWAAEQVPNTGTLGLVGPDHLEAMRMTTAKNAIQQAAFAQSPLPILVPDDYYQELPHPDIPSQVMLAGPGTGSLDPETGNRGFTACGIIGSDPAITSFQPVHPVPTAFALESLPLGGLTWSELLEEIAKQFPDGRFVLNTGFTYDMSFAERTQGWRIVDALFWRWLATKASYPFIHVTSAGESGALGGMLSQAAWSSPFALAETFPSLSDLAHAPATGVSIEELAEIESVILAIGGEPAPLGNLRIVGSSNGADHQASVFSGTGEDLRAVGENVSAICFVPSSSCDGVGAVVSSTRVATAQVSGLFGWLWTLAPDRTVEELLELVDFAWFDDGVPGVVDAYYATLGLDLSLADPRVRLAILDVADGSPAPSLPGNGLFDENDLAVFLAAFTAGVDPRYDLNGDGQVGGDGTFKFDLDVGFPPVFSTVSQLVEGQMLSFDETALTDLEILCYYAYSNLYVGDPQARTEMLAECNGVPAATVFLDALDQEVYASAILDGNLDSNGLYTSDPTGITVAFQANRSGPSGNASADVSYQSTYEEDSFGNPVKVTMNATGSSNFALTSGTGGANSDPQLGMSFFVRDAPVAYDLKLMINGSTVGGGGAVKVSCSVTLHDGNGNLLFEKKLNSNDDQFPASFNLSGVLPPNPVFFRPYTFDASFDVASTDFFGATSGSASGVFNCEFTLTP